MITNLSTYIDTLSGQPNFIIHIAVRLQTKTLPLIFTGCVISPVKLDIPALFSGHSTKDVASASQCVYASR